MEVSENLKNYKIIFDEISIKYYQIRIDDVLYNFSIRDLLEILFMDDNQYSGYLNNETLINNIKKEYYFYAIREFFKEYHLLTKYIFPLEIITRIENINNNTSIDLQSINQLVTQEGLKLDKIIINQELKEEILKDINHFNNNLEKAIYIYIKMCKILTYDEAYFVVKQDERYEVVRKHQDISNIKTITLSNNKVVCHEFNGIYAKLLNELGIITKTEYTGIKSYGKSHPFLIFKYEKFLIKVDSVTSIIYGDIANVKINEFLKGLICLNDNKETVEEFIKILSRVYNRIIEIESSDKNEIIILKNYEDIINKYCQGLKIELNLYEKLSILIKEVNSSKLSGIDALSYLLYLRKILFTKDELDNNIKFVIIRNNEFENKLTSSVVIVANDEDLAVDFYDNEYFIYKIGSEPISIDVVTLKNKFLNNEYQYVMKSISRIPNLVLENNLEIVKKLSLNSI